MANQEVSVLVSNGAIAHIRIGDDSNITTACQTIAGYGNRAKELETKIKSVLGKKFYLHAELIPDEEKQATKENISRAIHRGIHLRTLLNAFLPPIEVQPDGWYSEYDNR